MKIARTQAAFEDSSVVLMARIEDTDGAVATTAVLSSIIITVFDLADPTNKIAEVTLAPPFAGNFFDALQTGPTWRVDNEGFNFRYITLPAHLPDGDRIVRFDVKFLFTNGAAAHQAWDVPTLDLKRS